VGTYLIHGERTKKNIDDALAVGYRLFDTAHMYNNERDLGKAFKELLPKHNLTRNDIFITTKFGNSEIWKYLENVMPSCLQFLQQITKTKLIMRSCCSSRWKIFKRIILICSCSIGQVK
jgi:diketogulonate reductase-like aldo/keto reductase